VFCPECESEYREGFTRCADCDVDLVAELAQLAVPPDEDVIEIARYPALHVAQLAASVLESSDIACFIGDEFFSGMRPEIAFASGGVKLFVRDSDADRAREVLADFEQSIPESEETPD